LFHSVGEAHEGEDNADDVDDAVDVCLHAGGLVCVEEL
jgi:hypothetical protein